MDPAYMYGMDPRSVRDDVDELLDECVHDAWILLRVCGVDAFAVRVERYDHDDLPPDAEHELARGVAASINERRFHGDLDGVRRSCGWEDPRTCDVLVEVEVDRGVDERRASFVLSVVSLVEA